MPAFETAFVTEKYRKRCEDRVQVFNDEQRTVIVVADGAGGVGSGDVAAETVVREVETNWKSIHSADQWVNLLYQLDHQIGAGESTAVVVDVRPYGIAGASVGDSQAWIVDSDAITNLTSQQNRKPLLGSSAAKPIGFTNSALTGVLIVGTDGFFDYAKRDDVTRLVQQSEFYEIPRRCVDLVRLPSGDMWDDVGIVVARNKTEVRTRQRYEI